MTAVVGNEYQTDIFANYDPKSFYCELFGKRDLKHTRAIRTNLKGIDLKTLCRKSRDAKRELFNLGITFSTYSDQKSIDRILPFDVIPRLLSSKDWVRIEEGIKQRVTALNLFLHDVYHNQLILKDGVVPADLIKGNENYRKQMVGHDVPLGTYVHVSGTDLVRNEQGNFCVLEDNLRNPSGVSYVIENRHLMMRTFPDLANGMAVADLDDYGSRLSKALREVSPGGDTDPTIVLLSPGIYNSAYFEHVFLAREMGAPLAEGRDLLVENDKVYMRTINGNRRVHVIYRRINDEFLDPETFRKDSVLGVRGLFRAYIKGNVTLANAVGTGVGDDKAVYSYVPRIIKYYMDEEPILENIQTYICRETSGLSKTLDAIEKLVVKPVGEAGGYGVVVGPLASKRELSRLRQKIKSNPKNYVSQPVVELSVCPTLVGRSIEPRHVDLRPFALTGSDTWVLPGGLTRVAMRQGSFIVNSSQGGGSKDTWVLD